MSSNGFHRDSNSGLRNNSFDSSHLRNGNGIIPSSSSSPNQNHQITFIQNQLQAV